MSTFGTSYHVDLYIVSILDTPSLLEVSRINHYFAELCSQEEAWKGAFEEKFGPIAKHISGTQYKRYYQDIMAASSLSTSEILPKIVPEENEYLVTSIINRHEFDRNGIVIYYTSAELTDAGILTYCIKHDLVTAFKILYEHEPPLRTDGRKLIRGNTSTLEHALLHSSLKIVKWLWDNHLEEMNPPFTLEDLDEWMYDVVSHGNLELIRWASAYPRNWKPTDEFLIELAVSEHQWNVVDWLLEQGLKPTEVGDSIVIGGIPALEWYESRGILPGRYAANYANEDIESSSDRRDILQWLADRNIHPE